MFTAFIHFALIADALIYSVNTPQSMPIARLLDALELYRLALSGHGIAAQAALRMA
jgi:hypothetical protein